MSHESDIVLGAIWAVIDAAIALAGYDDVDVIRGSRRTEDASSLCVNVFWFTEMRRDSHYALDNNTLQVVLWEANADDSGLSEEACGISEVIDDALNGQVIGVESGSGYYGALSISRDGISVPSPEGYDSRSKEYFRILRYAVIIG